MPYGDRAGRATNAQAEPDLSLRQPRSGYPLAPNPSSDGELVEAQPKAFDLLVYLIEHRDRVVDKDELLEQLWSGSDRLRIPRSLRSCAKRARSRATTATAKT